MSRFDKNYVIQAFEASRDSTSTINDIRIDISNLEPSSTPVDQQTPILIKKLKQNTKQIGHYVICQCIAESYTKSFTQFVIEDIKGDAILVQSFHLFNDNTSCFKQEPLYTITKDGPTLQTFTPSDILIIDQAYYMINKFGIRDIVWKTKLTNPSFNETLQSLKETGNTLMRQKSYIEAFDTYTEALRITSKYSPEEQNNAMDITSMLILNRSAAAIACERFHMGMTDASMALELMGGSNQKALFRVGKSAYGMLRFKEAIEAFEELVKLSPSDDTIQKLLNSRKRLKEQNTGKYNHLKMLKESGSGKKLDHAEYFDYKSMQIERIHGKGKGIIAQKYIPQGTLLMVQKAMKVVYESDVPSCLAKSNIQYDTPFTSTSISPLQYKLTTDLIHLVSHNLTEAQLIYSIHNNHDSKPEPSLDSVHSGIISEAIMLNGYSNQQLTTLMRSQDMHNVDTSGDGVGLWYISSMLNHSCLSNAIQSYMGDMMLVYAKRGIQAGEEVCVSYCDSSISYPDRKSRLDAYGFECQCDLCIVGKKYSSDEMEIDLLLDTFVDVGEYEGGDDAWCVFAEDLVVKIKNLYEKRGKNAHRFALIYPLSRLATHYQLTICYSKSIQKLQELISICGIPDIASFMIFGVKDGVYLSHYLPGYCNQMFEVKYQSGEKFEALKSIDLSKKVALLFYGVNDAMWMHAHEYLV